MGCRPGRVTSSSEVRIGQCCLAFHLCDHSSSLRLPLTHREKRDISLHGREPLPAWLDAYASAPCRLVLDGESERTAQCHQGYDDRGSIVRGRGLRTTSSRNTRLISSCCT